MYLTLAPHSRRHLTNSVSPVSQTLTSTEVGQCLSTLQLGSTPPDLNKFLYISKDKSINYNN